MQTPAEQNLKRLLGKILVDMKSPLSSAVAHSDMLKSAIDKQNGWANDTQLWINQVITDLHRVVDTIESVSDEYNSYLESSK